MGDVVRGLEGREPRGVTRGAGGVAAGASRNSDNFRQGTGGENGGDKYRAAPIRTCWGFA